MLNIHDLAKDLASVARPTILAGISRPGEITPAMGMRIALHIAPHGFVAAGGDSIRDGEGGRHVIVTGPERHIFPLSKVVREVLAENGIDVNSLVERARAI